MTSDRRWTRRLLFPLLLFLMVVIVLEILLQVFYFATAGDWLMSRINPAIFEEDPHRCWRLQSNLEHLHATNEFSVTIYTNDQGIRTNAERKSFAYEKEPGVKRVMFFGPSFAYGWGNEWEDTYAARVGELLRAEGHEIEIMNMGLPAQGPYHQMCWWEKEGYKYEPDIVIAMDYETLGHIHPNCEEELWCPVVEDGEIFIHRPTLRQHVVARIKNLGIVFYGFYALHFFTDQPASQSAPGKELHRIDESGGATDVSEIVPSYLATFESFLTRAETRPIVRFLHLPLSYQVHVGDTQRYWDHGDLDPYREREELTQAISELEAEGLPMIFPLEALIAAGESERTYFWLDVHLTPAGNRVVAEELVKSLLPDLRPTSATP